MNTDTIAPDATTQGRRILSEPSEAADVGSQLQVAADHLRSLHAEAPRIDCWRCQRSIE